MYMAGKMTERITQIDSFALLANQRRRLAVRILGESSGPFSIGELAAAIGRREAGDPSTEDLRRIHVSLYHNHLPRLEAADVVLYDREEGTVRPHRNYDELAGVLEGANERDEPWSSD